MAKTKVTNEVIEGFLQGTDPQKYIVAVESYYDRPQVTLVINDNGHKYTEDHKYKPFLWFKEDIVDILYGGKRVRISDAAKKFNVKLTRLTTCDEDGNIPARMQNGYKFMATCTESYNRLIQFFKNGGVDIFHKDYSKYFVMFSPTEQFLIQSGKRLFRGMDDYDDIHRFQFDLETEGLFASRNAIFQIGVRDNRGFEGVIETLGETPYERRENERENIAKFFKVIDAIKPDVITGYNSENFDWPFIFERAERLGIPISELAITLSVYSKIKRKPAMIKLGGETERYEQTHMFGYNIIDISHAVRRAMAINSEIKGWGLKYITQYSEIAKPNRVYVPGDKINLTWRDKVNKYAFNDQNGDWYKITEKYPLKEGYVIKTGAYIVQRYLCDDLWETEQIDKLYNQASFLIAKMLPTTFMRSSTMGTAGQWKLLMAAWSYKNKLAIPETQDKRDFTGGLSRLLEVGYARNVYKFDYAALYPKTQLTHNIFPDLDISGVMESILTYVVDTRDKYKFLNTKEKKIYKDLEKQLESEGLTPTKIERLKKQIAEHKALANLYDKKQLPLKILANSWFGSYGAPYIFNWGDTDSAEETTCRGRQYLRLMVKHFTEKYKFRALVMDTDGCNFAGPDNLEDFKYVAKGTHWKTEEDAGKELTGIDAVLAEFNETFMEGRMGLDLDDVCDSTINFARKNYANDIGGKIKLVGNSVKSKKMPIYIEEFLAKGIRMLLDGDGHSFINYYYEYVDKIYSYQIPLIKMASKGKIKITMDAYKAKASQKNKAGNPMPKQAHMELALKEKLDTNLGDVLYYINTGTAKSHGDLKTVVTNKMTKKEIAIYKEQHGVLPVFSKEVQLNCRLINPDVVEKDFEMVKELDVLKKALVLIEENDKEGYASVEERIKEIEAELFTDDYNVARYLDAFNKKIKPLLVCFDTEIRDKILLDIQKVKNKETKKTVEQLKDRVLFTKGECGLISGKPYKVTDQDSYEDLMRMEDKEIKFWDKVNMVPNNMEEEEWVIIRADYIERMRLAKIEGMAFEKEKMADIIKHLEVEELLKAMNEHILPVDILVLADFARDDKGVYLFSRKWKDELCRWYDLFTYEQDALNRYHYYEEYKIQHKDNRFELWLDYVAECKILTGETITENSETIKSDSIEVDVEALKNNVKKLVVEEPKEEKKKRVYSEGEDDGDDDGIEEDDDGNLIRNDEELQLDDEIDDTFGEMPDDYIINEHPYLEQEQPKDEWEF